MEFSERISDSLFELEYGIPIGNDSDLSQFMEAFGQFSIKLSNLLTHYQTNLNATLSDNHIRGIVYFYHVHNFLTRPEFDDRLYLSSVSVQSITERFLLEKHIQIKEEEDVSESLQLNTNFHIFAGDDVLTIEFLNGLDRVSLAVVTWLPL